MKNITKFAAAAALASISAYAQSVSYTETTTGGNTLTPGTGNGTLIGYTTTLNLPQWNPALFPGTTLVGVQYTLMGEIFGRTVGSNPNAFPVAFVFDITSDNFSLTGPFGGSPGVSTLSASGSVPVINTGAIAPLASFGPTVTSLGSATSSAVSDPSNLASYIGSGTVSFGVSATSAFTLNGTAVGEGGEIFLQANSSTRGASTITVTYNYQSTAVPEPSTYAAMGFVGLVAGATIWRRRQMAKKA
jgi:hypothetical protein